MVSAIILSFTITGSHAKLDQVHRSLRSHEENVLAEMSKRLIELQNNICGSTLNVTERGSNRQNSKRVAAPDDINVVEPKVVRPNVHFGMSRPGTFELTRTTTETPSRSYVSNRPETNEAQTTNIISTSSFKTAVPKSCYVNWDNKSSILKNAKFVQFQELRAILEEISKKPTCIEDDGNVSVLLSTEEINATRQKIRALHKLSVNKYKRFPSTGNYINVNLNSKNNTELKKILFENGVYNFYEAAYSYLALIQNNTIDQGQFERSYSLKWSPDTINLDARW